jgi:hypothetical protein
MGSYISSYFSSPKITNKMNKPIRPTTYKHLRSKNGYITLDNINGGGSKKHDNRCGKYKHNGHTHKTLQNKKMCKK